MGTIGPILYGILFDTQLSSYMAGPSLDQDTKMSATLQESNVLIEKDPFIDQSKPPFIMDSR